MIGSEIGGMVGQSMRGAGSGVQSGAASTGQSGNNSRGMGSDFAGALANIADIYSSNRASQDLKQNISAMQSGGPKQSLESLYGPDSPYAIQLRQQLERKDATAAHQWSIKGFNTRACGSSGYALIPHSLNLAAWANDIFFMKQENYDEVISKWQDKGLENALESLKAKSHILDIPDIYELKDFSNKSSSFTFP